LSLGEEKRERSGKREYHVWPRKKKNYFFAKKASGGHHCGCGPREEKSGEKGIHTQKGHRKRVNPRCLMVGEVGRGGKTRFVESKGGKEEHRKVKTKTVFLICRKKDLSRSKSGGRKGEDRRGRGEKKLSVTLNFPKKGK